MINTHNFCQITVAVNILRQKFQNFFFLILMGKSDIIPKFPKHFTFYYITEHYKLYVCVIFTKYTNTSYILVDTWAKNLDLTWTESCRPPGTPGTSPWVQAPQRGSPRPWGQILVEVHFCHQVPFHPQNQGQPKILVYQMYHTINRFILFFTCMSKHECLNILWRHKLIIMRIK